MSPGTGALIAAVTLANIAGALWLLWWTRRRRGEAAQAETTGHVWDGDLREYNNPLPRWWLWLYIATVAFALVYLVLYPGLGVFAGTKGWSQTRQYEEQKAQAERVLARTFAPFEKQTVSQLEEDADALRIGRNLFVNNCATCHGSDGRGAPGFPNLADGDWLWGGSAEAVLESIGTGRIGVMAPWGEVVGAQGVEDLLTYVMSLSGRRLTAGDAARGREKFTMLCAACHGSDGRGNAALGAPNLADTTWLHGGSLVAIRNTITNGRQGEMPAHLERLGETRVKILAAYVRSLGAPPQAQVSHNVAPR
ncbi:MAG TPA: cytochrome-c oxidase, cbb3-type subunit III [Steroidobacteraceae bacterium]|nr:cytochrome-c oxidase, cbb3-type subunit III [Steroidobacteraceae bacterium]